MGSLERLGAKAADQCRSLKGRLWMGRYRGTGRGTMTMIALDRHAAGISPPSRCSVILLFRIIIQHFFELLI